MRFSHDRRGQSVVIGTVILFGFLIVALAVYQAQIVPQDNAQVEFEHSQSVEGDFVDLRNAVLSAGRSGDDRSTSIPLGTRYPQRTFFVNPPPATGQLSTSDPGGLRIENARVDAEGNVAAYWTDRIDEDDAIAFDTRSIRYAPDYTEFRNPPDLVYEHSFVVAEFDDAALGRTGQTAVDTDRNRIRLTALDGDLRESGVERGSVDPEVLSQNRRSVTLESDDGGPIVLRLPTDVSMDRADDLVTAWERQLGEDVQEVTVAGGEVRIELDGDDSYRLELGKVGVGTGAAEPAADDRYITAVPSQRVAAVAEVRDRYNNPVEGVAVDVDVDGSPVETLRTDDDGRVEYVPDGQPTVEMRINEGDEDWEELRFDAGTVGTGDGGGDNINPGENSDVVLNDVGLRGGQQTVDLQFRNNADEDREFREMEFTLYYRPQGDTRESFTVRGPDDTGQELTLRGGFVELDAPFVIPAGGTATFTIEFDANAQNDLLGVSVRDDLNRQALYLAGIEGSIDEEDEQSGENGNGDNGGNGDGGSEPPQVQNGISYEGGLTTTTTGSAVQFDIRNVGSDFARVESVTVESPIDGASQLYNGNGGRIIETTGADADGFRQTDSGGANSRAVDVGSSIDLTQNAVLSTSGGGVDAGVFIGQFGTANGGFTQYNFGTLARVTQDDDWDVRIVLEFQNRNDVAFYFAEQ